MEAFGFSVDEMLDSLSVPRIELPGASEYYVSLYALEMTLFDLGLPTAFTGDRPLAKRVHHELAAVTYGTLSKEVLKARVRELANVLAKGRSR